MAFSTLLPSCGNRSFASGFSAPGPVRLEVSLPPTRLSSSASRLLRRRWNGSQLPGVSFECQRCIEGQTQEMLFPRPLLRCEGIQTPALPFRVGHGFDLHRLEKGYKLIVGGVTLEHDRGCVGHSDGDVVLHTVTDAILGALGEPDIGQLFPDKDPKWKGAASHVFLTEAVRRMWGRGYSIGNVDVTVILERPKMSPHKAAIKHNIAQLLHAPVERINVKAKTHEKVDSLGENRSIACHAVVTLLLNTTPASSSSTSSCSSSASSSNTTITAGSPSSQSEPASAEVLSQLFLVIEGRKGADPSSSYTAKLLAAGVPKIAQKVGEEGVETVIEATCGTREKLVGESADLLYHLLVLWAARDIEPSAVWAELERRTGTSGIAEKAARAEQ